MNAPLSYNILPLNSSETISVKPVVGLIGAFAITCVFVTTFLCLCILYITLRFCLRHSTPVDEEDDGNVFPLQNLHNAGTEEANATFPNRREVHFVLTPTWTEDL